MSNLGKWLTVPFCMSRFTDEKWRFIPEFVGRLPSITSLAPLTIPDLRRILTEVKGSLVSQYISLFGYSGIEIRFTSAALDEICKKAFERGGGARGLRGIMVNQCFPPMDIMLMIYRKPCYSNLCMKHRECFCNCQHKQYLTNYLILQRISEYWQCNPKRKRGIMNWSRSLLDHCTCSNHSRYRQRVITSWILETRWGRFVLGNLGKRGTSV